MIRLAKFWRLTRHEKFFFSEAMILLSISSICVKTIAFRRIDKFLRTRWNDTLDCADHDQKIKFIHRFILLAANVLPWKSLCLSRSIAEFIMLRRRGIPAVIFAGVKVSGHASLDAHAWINTGQDVNDKGSENSDFTPVITIGRGALDSSASTPSRTI